MRSQHRDGLLALVGLAVLCGLSVATGGIDRLLQPLGIAGGVVAALAVEVIFLEYPAQSVALWERRGVPLAGLLAVLVVAFVALRFVPWLLAVPVWGLLTYLALLACLLLGFENPVAVLLGSGE